MLKDYATVDGFDYISRGSYAKVYGNDQVAVKIYTSYDDCFFSVLREGLLLQSVGPKILGILNDSKGIFKGLVMERALFSLSKMFYDSKNTSGVLRIFRDVLGDLCDLHKKGLVHGDIKPANILVMPNGRGTLCDFGLTAFSSTEGPSPCLIEETYTPMYRSPELLESTPPYAVTTADDIWAFGLTLYTTFINVSVLHRAEEVPGLHISILRDNDDERKALYFNRLLGLHNASVIAEVLSECLNPHTSQRPTAARLYARLSFVSHVDALDSVFGDVKSTTVDTTVPKLMWSVASNIPRVIVPQSALNSCALIAKNIWAVVHIVFVNEDNTLLKSCLELFSLLRNEDWSISKCAVIAAVLSGCLVRRSGRFHSAWCSRMAGVTIYDYDLSLGQSLSIAIANPEWSKHCYS